MSDTRVLPSKPSMVSLGLKSVGVVESRMDSSPSQRLCLILLINGDTCIFILDLTDSIAGDADKPVQIRPNLRIPRSFGTVMPCVVGSTLYLFSFPSSTRVTPEVYSFKLSSPTVLNSSDFVLDRCDELLKKMSTALGPKLSPEVIPYRIEGYGTVMIIFSTTIRFWDRMNHQTDLFDMVDFEIYDPKGEMSRKLPQLRLRPKSRFRTFPIFELCDAYSVPLSEEFYAFKFNPSASHFHVTSFGFGEGCFFIQTNVGRMFCLSLGWPNDHWRVCEEGVEFNRCNMNFVTPYGLCIDAYGINAFKANLEFWRRWDSPYRSHEIRSYASFPVSSIGGLERGEEHSAPFSVGLLDTCPSSLSYPCIVQLGYDSTRKLCWILDVFRADLHKLATKAANDEDEYEDEENEDEEFVERIKSFRFCLQNELVRLSDFVGMFPF